MDHSEYFQIEQVEETHFWYRAMEQLALNTIHEALPDGCGLILDVGCGPGGMTQKLTRFGQVTGIDIHPTAHTIGRHKVNQLIMGDACALPLADDRFDLVTVFDVLYNQAITDDIRALTEIFRVLKPGGWLYLREPALEQLRGAHDLVVKTRHRYTVAEICQALGKIGFTIQKISYANLLLGIPIWIKRSYQKLNKKQHAASDTAQLPDLFNRLFYFILHNENKLVQKYRLPFGSSVICLAYKPENKTKEDN